MLVAILAVLVYAVVYYVIFFTVDDEQNTTENTVNIESIENAELAIDKARAIGELVTQESNGLVHVSYVVIPSHGISQNTGHEHFGVHYSMQILRRSDLVTGQELNRAKELAGRIFQLTTKHIIADNHDVTHMGVQIVDPDAWFWDGTDAHLYIATRDVLTSLPENAHASAWFNASSDTPVAFVPESALR